MARSGRDLNGPSCRTFRLRQRRFVCDFFPLDIFAIRASARRARRESVPDDVPLTLLPFCARSKRAASMRTLDSGAGDSQDTQGKCQLAENLPAIRDV